MARPLPNSIDETQRLLASGDYVADRSLATSLFLALAMRRPLFLEGEAGVGKTEIAKVIAQGLGRELIRLQCYDGLDIAQAAYEWNYSRQMIEIRLAEAAGEKSKEKLDHLPRIVPLVGRLRDIESLVALQTDELPAQALGDDLGDLGLADPGLAFEEQRPAHGEGKEKGGGEAAIGDVVA